MTKIRNTSVLVFALFLAGLSPCRAQSDGQVVTDRASVTVTRAVTLAPTPAPVVHTGPLSWFEEHIQGLGSLHHPYRVEARHPDGTLFYSYDGVNLRTSAGTTWQSQLMGSVSTPTVNAQCNYLALTNTGITPAEADTTLSGEITTNGLGRAQATYTDVSTTLTVPVAPVASVVGTTGAVSYWYWVAACNQGICTTPSLASNNITTANATLSTTNYDKVTWTGQQGASTYQVYRTTSSSAPSGTSTVQVQGNPECDATTTTCTIDDESNTLVSVVIPASNLTNFGKFTLVKTWTATGGQSAQAFGVFTAVSTGTMCFEGTFTAVTLNLNDTLALTESVFF